MFTRFLELQAAWKERLEGLVAGAEGEDDAPDGDDDEDDVSANDAPSGDGDMIISP